MYLQCIVKIFVTFIYALSILCYQSDAGTLLVIDRLHWGNMLIVVKGVFFIYLTTVLGDSNQ